MSPSGVLLINEGLGKHYVFQSIVLFSWNFICFEDKLINQKKMWQHRICEVTLVIIYVLKLFSFWAWLWIFWSPKGLVVKHFRGPGKHFLHQEMLIWASCKSLAQSEAKSHMAYVINIVMACHTRAITLVSNVFPKPRDYSCIGTDFRGCRYMETILLRC